MSRYTGDAAMRRTEDIEDTMAEYLGLEKKGSKQTNNPNTNKNQNKEQVSTNPLVVIVNYHRL